MDASQSWRNGQTGFTLLELLIAITIFSILSTVTYTGLKTVLDTEQQTRVLLENLANIQIGLHLLQRDIEQAVNREVRDEFGDALPPMRSGGMTGPLLEFTHGGYPNPMEVKRSSLQRVAYQLEEDRLYRLTWPALDRAQETMPAKTSLLSKIKSVQINYYDQQMKPHAQWPEEVQEASEASQYPLPKAVEVSLEIEGVGSIRRLFRVAELSDS
jgi:general secretion pathway protein J